MDQDSELLKDLTDEQRAAASHVDGPLLIIAGAGSGKTRVITRRVAYLISLGIPPSQILAITFTNKAAGEMKERIGSVTGRKMHDFGKLDQQWPTVCTFHSLCLRILRHYGTQLGIPPNFSIFDSNDQNKLLKEAIKALDLSSTNFPPGTVHGTISNAKNQLLSAEAYARNAQDFYGRNVARIYHSYERMLIANNAMDFDDLLLRSVHAFRTHPQMLDELQDRFRYILIDEYQDTNHAQYMLAHALAMKHRNICVVGDPDQSIYAWRGADMRNIMEFEKDYPDATVVRLERNYRSTKTILALASKLIANNRHRRDKSLWTENAQGEKAEMIQCQDEHDEATVVTERFKQMHAQGYTWNQMAIFYRMNALSRVMEDALRKANVPYQIARGVEFYNRKEIRDVMAYLRVVSNPDDEVSLARIVNTPTRGIGDASIKQMQVYAVGNGLTLWQAMQQVEAVEGVSSRAVKAVQNFVKLVASWRHENMTADVPSDMLMFKAAPSVRGLMEQVVRESGLEAMYRKEGGDEQEELGNINELITSAAEFERDNPDGSLVDYLAQVSLVSDADHLKDSGGAVTLMTLHAAKGLEFEVVAMIGLEEGVLPHSRARDSMDQMEEERRLCFVGITRAQERLILSKAAYRTIRGLRERTVTSPFLGELPLEYVDIIDRTGLPRADRDDEWRERASTEQDRLGSQFFQGQKVRHPAFGLGTIIEMSQAGQHTRAVVEFQRGGRKTLLLQYAKLQPA